jgi:hypothetical protein
MGWWIGKNVWSQLDADCRIGEVFIQHWMVNTNHCPLTVSLGGYRLPIVYLVVQNVVGSWKMRALCATRAWVYASVPQPSSRADPCAIIYSVTMIHTCVDRTTNLTDFTALCVHTWEIKQRLSWFDTVRVTKSGGMVRYINNTSQHQFRVVRVSGSWWGRNELCALRAEGSCL